jgi:hypothetical protein
MTFGPCVNKAKKTNSSGFKRFLGRYRLSETLLFMYANKIWSLALQYVVCLIIVFIKSRAWYDSFDPLPSDLVIFVKYGRCLFSCSSKLNFYQRSSYYLDCVGNIRLK